MLKLPYSLLPPALLYNLAHKILGLGQFLEFIFPFLDMDLKRAKLEISSKAYLGMCLIASSVFMGFMWVLLSILFFVFALDNAVWVGLLIAFLFALFVFMQQLIYPKLITAKRIRNIEKHLMAAMQNMLVQLNSGVPLFDILVNIYHSNYGDVSKEFGTAVKEINSGRNQTEVLEELAATNPSLFFRRAIWQIVNGMKSGSDISNVIRHVIQSLSEEQVVQIQRYGSQLNPLAMFYMLVAVIIPSLGMTFMLIIFSFISISEGAAKMVFLGMYGFFFFFQIMFLGVIRSRRPNLLGDE